MACHHCDATGTSGHNLGPVPIGLVLDDAHGGVEVAIAPLHASGSDLIMSTSHARSVLCHGFQKHR